MDVRIRLPELMHAAGVTTTYAFSMQSGERIPMNTAHRLVAAQGAVCHLDADMLDVQCGVFGVPESEPLTGEPPPGAAVTAPMPTRKRSKPTRASARGRAK